MEDLTGRCPGMEVELCLGCNGEGECNYREHTFPAGLVQRERSYEGEAVQAASS